MAVKYKILTVVDKDIKDRIAQLMEITGHSESKQTKLLLARVLEMEKKLNKIK